MSGQSKANKKAKHKTLIFSSGGFNDAHAYAVANKLELSDWISCWNIVQLNEYIGKNCSYVFLPRWERGKDAAFIVRCELIERGGVSNVTIVSADK